MDPRTFRILERKRFGGTLTPDEIRAVADGAASGEWGDAELGAFLMAAAIRGLEASETRELVVAMLESGETWDLRRDFPGLVDKHSTGGVGDKVSLVLAPILAVCGRPVVMLTGRGLGHTGGTADKLESIPGLSMSFDRELCCRALEETGMAVGMATGEIAPADRRLYALRDRTATVSSLELITGSILSKKLATGAGAIVFDVKCGDGAFIPEPERAARLARMLVETCRALGVEAGALLTDMSQPLGRWAGHTAEVREALEALEGNGPDDLMEVVYALCEELSSISGARISRSRLEKAVSSGDARQRFDRWAELQGADPAWLRRPVFELAPGELVIEAPRSGHLAKVATRRLGELLAAAGGGRLEPGGTIDTGVSLRLRRRLGDRVEKGDELARLYLRQLADGAAAAFQECWTVADAAEPPELIRERIP